MDSFFRCTPRQARRLILQILQAGLVPYIQSSPGMGKSSIIRSICEDMGWVMIDHRLSTSDPTDLTGLPFFVDGQAKFMPFTELFPIEGMEIPEGMNGWLIFLDEFNSAPRSVQAAAYKVILDRMVGQHRLHENVLLAAAGNLSTDKAIVNPLSTAMQSRLVHLEMRVDFEEWREDVAIKENYDSRIIAFLSQYPSKLMDFDPEHHDKTFCCPRTWEFVNKLIKGRELDEDSTILLAGTITSGVATEFVQFCKVYKDMIPLQEILQNPEGCRLPSDISLKWATITHLTEHIKEENFEAISTYVNRFTMDFQILFYRSIMIRNPDLRSHPQFGKAMGKLTQYLHSTA